LFKFAPGSSTLNSFSLSESKKDFLKTSLKEFVKTDIEATWILGYRFRSLFFVAEILKIGSFYGFRFIVICLRRKI
jgi:hypothetical protein